MASGRYFSFGGTPYRVTGMSDTVNRSPAYEEACDIPTRTYAVGGPYMASGTVDMLYRNDAVQALMASLLGGTGEEFTDNPATGNIEIGDEHGGYATRYSPACISGVEITLNTRDFVKCRWNWLGSKATAALAGATGSSAPADNAAVWYNATITAGGSEIDCKSLTFRLDRKFDTDYFYIGSPFLQGFYQNGPAEIGGTITLGSGQYTELRRVIAGGATASAITACENELDVGELSIVLLDKDCGTLGTITAGNIVFAEMTRSVTSRNLWDKSINYSVVLPTNADFAISYDA